MGSFSWRKDPENLVHGAMHSVHIVLFSSRLRWYGRVYQCEQGKARVLQSGQVLENLTDEYFI